MTAESPLATLKASGLRDPFNHSSIGRQLDSQKESQPNFSFGTGDRDVARRRLYVGAKHQKAKLGMTSPGPVYNVQSTIGEGKACGMGLGPQRAAKKAQYPDSSVDINCAAVDSQTFKYGEGTHTKFGVEERGKLANAEVLMLNPSLMYGVHSPGALEYTPDDKHTAKKEVAYSFAPRNAGPGTDIVKVTPRLHRHPTSTPRQTGPGSHKQPSSLGPQPHSARSSAPCYGFSSAERPMARKEPMQNGDNTTAFSSLGRQVVSTVKSTRGHSFGTASRSDTKTQYGCAPGDGGPAAHMPKLNFRVDLPVHCARMPAGSPSGI